MLFAKLAPGQGQSKILGGRARCSYQNTLDVDIRYVYSGIAQPKSLDYLVGLAASVGGPQTVKQVLAELSPDEEKGTSVLLVRTRKRDISCPIAGCAAVFAERKEVNRHQAVAHGTRIVVQGTHGCDKCNRSFKTSGWLDRHKLRVHAV
jgi:uncharacterized C2H2 Zn-finger protein